MMVEMKDCIEGTSNTPSFPPPITALEGRLRRESISRWLIIYFRILDSRLRGNDGNSNLERLP